jgi:hypothetical protein
MRQGQRERFVYGSVLEALTKGLYPDKRHVLREFVQNAFDGLHDLRRADRTVQLKPIQVRIERPSIFIYDEGIGMSEQLMRQYRYVGFSQKNPLETVGFRGIGKMSGVAVAKRIVVTSSRRGIPERYEVVIDAEGMFDRLRKERNPVLDQLLDQFSQVRQERERQDAHYTAVELQDIRQDSESLYDVDDVREYLRQTIPLPLDPGCPYAVEVCSRLRSEVQDFFECELSFNGSPLFKPFPTDVLAPQYIPIFESDNDGSPLIGLCWYVKNAGKGQIEAKHVSGLTYRMKNFAVGDRSLPRENLWSSTPERAFYFYGEIHLTDLGLVPTADRTDFEDNAARQRMYERCQRISQQLNREAGLESEHRRFGEVLSLTERLVGGRRQEMKSGQLDVAIRPDVQYQVRKALEEVEKRMARTKAKREKVAKDNELIRQGRTVVRHAKGLLNELEAEDAQLFDVKKAVPMSEEAQRMYDVVISVLRDELRSDLPVFERILRRLRERIPEAFGSAA